MSHVLEVSGLVKRFGDHEAVKGISFSIEEGRVYGFLGPNGAGKSTTMNMITGYIGATEGTVYIDGHNIETEPEAAKRAVGYLPEMPPLYMDMTVNEYLSFSAELKGIPKAERKENVERVMELTGLTNVRGRLIKNLSKGYKQRVGLGHALMGFPKILILDEPTVGLDPKQIIEIRSIIKELAKEHTVIFSSHILAEVSEVADHILIISGGRLVASGTIEELERRLSGDNELRIVVRGDRAKAEQILAGIEGTEMVPYDGRPGEGLEGFAVRMPEGVDAREDIFYGFAENRIPIVSMGLKYSSLEDLFLELTSRDAEPGEEAGFGIDAAGEGGDER